MDGKGLPPVLQQHHSHPLRGVPAELASSKFYHHWRCKDSGWAGRAELGEGGVGLAVTSNARSYPLPWPDQPDMGLLVSQLAENQEAPLQEVGLSPGEGDEYP